MKYSIFLLLLTISFCHAEINSENLPKIPSLDDVDEIKERCEEKGGTGTYDKLKKSLEETQKCVVGLIDVSKVKEELQEAEKTGSMDEVFGKYCAKRPQLKECLKESVDIAKQCLEENEKQALKVTTNILEQIGDFACFQDGDRLAMFVAEDGIQCLQSRSEGIQQCLNKTIKANSPSFSPNSIPNLTIDKKKCDNLAELQSCIVKDLEENCENSTPANIVDALFKFVKKIACKNVKNKRSVVSLKRGIRSAVQMASNYQANARELLNRTCIANGGDDAFDKLWGAINTSLPCFLKYRPLVSEKDVFLENVASCAEKPITALEDCLPTESKYYPRFAFEIITTLIDFIYSHKDLLESNTFRNDIMACGRSLEHMESQKHILKCAEHNNMTSESGILEVPSKEVLCEKSRNTNDCVVTIIRSSCSTQASIIKLLQEFIVAIESPCNANKSENEA